MVSSSCSFFFNRSLSYTWRKVFSLILNFAKSEIVLSSCVWNPSRVYGVGLTVGNSGTAVGVGGAAVTVGVAVDGSGVAVKSGVDVDTNSVGVAVCGKSVNCSEFSVGRANSVGVMVGVGVPSGKKLYAS